MTKCTGAVAQISRMLRWMPFQCRTFLGQPYFVPGTTPNMFFMLKRNASPVVGLDLRHRHDEVRVEYSPRQPQVLQTRVGGPRWHFEQFVAVQIDEMIFWLRS